MANEDQKTAERIQLAAVSPSAGVTRRLKKISGVEGGMAESMSRFDWFVVMEVFGPINLLADVPVDDQEFLARPSSSPPLDCPGGDGARQVTCRAAIRSMPALLAQGWCE